MTEGPEEQPEEVFQVVPLDQLLERRRQSQDRQNMAVTEFRQSIDRFFDELTKDQMFTFYRMLTHMTDTSAQFWAGVASVYLRKIHKICTSCGETDHTLEEHVFIEMKKQAEEEMLRDLQVPPPIVGEETDDESDGGTA